MEYIKENEFKEAVLSNDLKTVQRLIGEGVDPSLWDNYAIRWASIRGYTKMVERLLLDSRIDPNDWVLFEEVCGKGHLEVVESLLLDSRVDNDIIMSNFGTPLSAAAEHCHVDIVKALLASPTVKFSGFDYQAMYLIFRYASIEVCELFIKDQRWRDPEFDIETEFQEFPYSGHPEASRVLLDNNAVKATDEIKRACEDVNLELSRKFQTAVMKGNLEEVKEIITDNNNIDPSLGTPFGNWALSIASERGHLEIVNYLLTDPRVGMGRGLERAAENGHLEVVKVLLQDPRCGDIGDCLEEACRNGYVDILDYLLADERVKYYLQYIHDSIFPDAVRIGHNAIVTRLLKHLRLFHADGDGYGDDLKLFRHHEHPGALVTVLRQKPNVNKSIILKNLRNDDMVNLKKLLANWRVYMYPILNKYGNLSVLPDPAIELLAEYIDGPYGATEREIGVLLEFLRNIRRRYITASKIL
jgi:hypothetical protein